MRPPGVFLGAPVAIVAALLAAALPGPLVSPGPTPSPIQRPVAATGDPGALGNFSAALGRIVTLLGAAGGTILAIAWARVALSWFSNDVTKKIQAKDRARDALIGSVIFAAALSGILWGLAQWILTGA